MRSPLSMVRLAVVALACTAAQSSAQVSYYFDYGTVPALYKFEADGAGLRTTYPSGSLSFGTPYPFAWKRNGTQLVLQFASGYTDNITITGYSQQSDTIARIAPGWGDSPWFGCSSGRIPPLLANQLCQRAASKSVILTSSGYASDGGMASNRGGGVRTDAWGQPIRDRDGSRYDPYGATRRGAGADMSTLIQRDRQIQQSIRSRPWPRP